MAPQGRRPLENYPQKLGAARNVQGCARQQSSVELAGGEFVHVQGFVQPRAHGGGRRTGCWHTACITSACMGLGKRV